jgi:flagellar basal-body rod protein FlgF
VQSNYYVTLSGLVALEQRLSTVANNIANMNTVGYRAGAVSFESVISKKGDTPVAYASAGVPHISRLSGSLLHTGNPLDIAVQGDAWFAVQTPAGTVYTRDGRMRLQPDGALQTLNGYPVLDAGNSPMLLEANGGSPTISQDGMVTQSGRQIGAVGLFTIDPKAKLTRYDNSGVISDKPGTAVLDFSATGIAQGFVEGANMNPVMEMAKMMMISRDFESISSAMSSSETSHKDAIKTLGSNS